MITIKFLVFVSLLLLQTVVHGSVGPKVVQLEQGAIEGVTTPRVISFKGIPYAQPPTGDLRWQSPQPVKPLARLFKAYSFGAKCLQPSRGNEAAAGMSEDCLTLNVWTPGLDKSSRPVMVYIHGGGFRAGSGDIPGEVFAAQGAVVVSINYRLGPLGFFAHPALADRPANPAVLDMIASLQWVQDNIAQFGGDPDNVMIFGISAGAMAVNLLMTNDRAKGLVHKAIAQSGYAGWSLPRSRTAPLPAPGQLDGAVSAEHQAQAMVATLSSKAQNAALLIGLDGRRLVNSFKGFTLPIVDGDTVAEEPGIGFIRGWQLDIPYISGGNSFEGSVMPASGISNDDYIAMLGADIEQARQLYRDDSDSIWLQRLFGDNRYLLSARVLADSMHKRSAKAWLYYTDFVAAAEDGSAQRSPGTTHGSDGYFLFQGHEHSDNSVRKLSRELQQYWLAFALHGDPNVKGLSPWPSYARDSDNWLVFSQHSEARSGILADKLDFLESRYRRRVAPALHPRCTRAAPALK